MSSRFFGNNNKLLSDTSIKKWIISVNSSDPNPTPSTRRHFSTTEVPEDPVLEAAYAETRNFVDNFIRRDALADLKDELRFFDDYDKTIETDLEYESNGIPKLSSLPRRPSPPPIDYDQPDDAIVNSIIEKLMEKPIFPREVESAGFYGTESTANDSQTVRVKSSSRSAASVANHSARTADFHARMKVRQEIVKHNRERREADDRIRKREEVAKREMMAEAKRRAAMEQRERELREKAEEEEIRKEMIKIKQQMESQRKLITKLNLDRRAVTDAAEAAARAELDLEVAKKQEIEDEVKVAMEEQRRLKMVRLEQIMKARESENVKLVQRCFRSWYSMILDDRLSVARFRAVTDWRRIVRSWNKWRTAANKIVIERDAKQHADKLRNDYRKESVAENHYKRRVLSACFQEWREFVEKEKDIKAIEASKEERRAKMASFLAAATAAAVVAQNNPPQAPVTVCDPVISRGVDELFSSPVKGYKLDLKQLSSDEERHHPSSGNAYRARGGKQMAAKPVRKVHSAGSHQSSNNNNRASRNIGSAAQDLMASSQSEDENGPISGNLRRSPDRQAARQKQIINLQRERLRDQQMLIKELSYARKQTEMMQQIAKYEELLRGLEQLTKVSQRQLASATATAAPTTARPPTTDRTPTHKSKQLSSSNAATPKDPHAENGNNSAPSNDESSNKPETTDVNEDAANNDEQEDADTRYVSPRSQSPSSEAIKLQLAEATKLLNAAAKSSTRTTTSSALSSNRRIRAPVLQPVDTEFTKKMEERADLRRRMKEEREKKKQEAEQQKIDEERMRQEELKRKEEEEKRAKVEEVKRKRQLEKEKEEQRLREVQRDQELGEKATEANVRRVLRHAGWLPWRRLVDDQRQRWQKAVDHHSVCAQRQALVAWSTFVRTDLAERRHRAAAFFDRLIVRRCFFSWQKYGNYMLILEEKADRHYRAALMVEMFNKWDRYVDNMRRKEIRDEESAENHNLKRMLKFVFKAWRKVPLMIREERQRQHRLEEMRRKVASILPDYQPVSTGVLATPPPQSVTQSVAVEEQPPKTDTHD